MEHIFHYFDYALPYLISKSKYIGKQGQGLFSEF